MNEFLFTHLKVDRRSKVPFGKQVKYQLHSLLMEQVFPFKSSLPKAELLAKSLGIETKDVLDAYQELAKERYLILHKDNTAEVIIFDLSSKFADRIYSIYEEIIRLGLKPSIQCLEAKYIDLSQEELKQMDFAPNEKVFYLKRLYLGDNMPFALIYQYFPSSIFPKIDQWLNCEAPAFTQLFQKDSIKIVSTSKVIRAINLNEEEATLLQQRENCAGLCVFHHYFDQQNRNLSYDKTLVINRYLFQIDFPYTMKDKNESK